ncbi:hypothetical protein Rhopal_007649-T1 [Rhodotorula paludigena]|uniref:Proteophosphoglycan ppg4 n=1 Tax=Rhodotorula paludigena TaxID=86838 RepID=A0AAV5GQ95_9BASI|nr:hypothetical protein Rhopal_007649-T1 [Rhodotorula paludigena]
MAVKAPASAALLAQSQALGPDLSPLVSSVSRQPTASIEGSPEPALVATRTPTDAALALSPFELACGEAHSTRRLVSFCLAALALSTAVRAACFAQPVFGKYLLENLAPVERDSVRWRYLVVNRAWETAAGAWVWHRINGVIRGEGAVFGCILALVARVSLYAFEHSYFLLSTQTVAVLLLIDAVAFASAFSLAPTFLPHPPSARPVLSAFTRLRHDPAQWLNLVVGVALATFVGALGGFVLERCGGRAFVERNVIEATVPSYLLKDELTTSEVLEHPSWTIPSLRTYDFPLSMAHHLLQSSLSALSLVPLLTALPSLAPSRLAPLAALLVGVPAVGVYYDVLPVTLVAALTTGAALAVRAAVQAGVLAWVLEELRRTKTSRAVRIVLVDPLSGEVIAEREGQMEEDARGTLRKDERGVTRRRVTIRGDVEL